jgi:hypothetical protein
MSRQSSHAREEQDGKEKEKEEDTQGTGTKETIETHIQGRGARILQELQRWSTIWDRKEGPSSFPDCPYLGNAKQNLWICRRDLLGIRIRCLHVRITLYHGTWHLDAVKTATPWGQLAYALRR